MYKYCILYVVRYVTVCYLQCPCTVCYLQCPCTLPCIVIVCRQVSDYQLLIAVLITTNVRQPLAVETCSCLSICVDFILDRLSSSGLTATADFRCLCIVYQTATLFGGPQ